MKQVFIITLCLFSFAFITAQTLSKDTYLAFKNDNASGLKNNINTDDINICYDIKDSQYTLLTISIKMNASACFDYLLNKENIDLNKTCSGKTASQYTAKYGNLEMLKKLEESGADFSSSINGRSVLDYAKKYEQKEIITYLSEKQKI